MNNQNKTVSMVIIAFLLVAFSIVPLHAETISRDVLKLGEPLPDAVLNQFEKGPVRLKDLMGRVKILSIVPQLNTPVCDEQTHRFSETNGGLDQFVQLVTISTNSAEDQNRFAQKAGIRNMTFLSDRPQFDFGERTGLLYRDFGYLKRTVIVVDKNNIVRYVDWVPGGGLPQIKKALKAARKVLRQDK